MRLVALALLVSSFAFANDQQGSLNTYNGDGSTTNSNNVTEDNSVNNSYSGAGASSQIPVGSAISPSYMSNGMDTCLKGSGGSLQTVGVGFSSGEFIEDVNCLRLKESKLLSDLNMKVAAISRLCDSVQVFRSMLLAGSPCPLIQNNRLVVGKRAFLALKSKPELYIPDYKDNAEWYNGILNIGEVTEDVQEDYMSISDKFRTSKQQ
nr:hypothetical protein [uncultured Mediterranean phage uvMED]